jgi:hypothetical protein
VICLCRRHHDMHGHGDIQDLTLQMLLYHFYGYGPEEWLCNIFEEIKDIAESYGLQPRFSSDEGDQIEVLVVGLRICHSFVLSMDALKHLGHDTLMRMIKAEMQTAARLADDKHLN